MGTENEEVMNEVALEQEILIAQKKKNYSEPREHSFLFCAGWPT
jgi:hypothetical protein